MPPPRLTHTVHDGASLGDDQVLAMWQLRLRVIDLKPSVDPEDDLRKFVRRCRSSQYVLRFWDHGGVLRGIFMIHVGDERFGNTRYLGAFPEYGFFHPSFRRDPEARWAFLLVVLRLLLRARGRPVYAFIITYLQGFLAFTAFHIRLFTLAEGDAPPLVRDLLERSLSRFAGDAWDRSTHRVSLPTLPRSPDRTWWEAMGHRPDVQRYLSLNPDWLKGNGLASVYRIDRSMLLKVLWGLISRRRRR